MKSPFYMSDAFKASATLAPHDSRILGAPCPSSVGPVSYRRLLQAPDIRDPSKQLLKPNVHRTSSAPPLQASYTP